MRSFNNIFLQNKTEKNQNVNPLINILNTCEVVSHKSCEANIFF